MYIFTYCEYIIMCIIIVCEIRAIKTIKSILDKEEYAYG